MSAAPTASERADRLSLIAFDGDDLTVLSAHVQDATLRTGAIEYRPRLRRLTLPLHRYRWEKAATLAVNPREPGERRLALLRIDHVEHVRSRAIDRAGGDAVVSLLTLSFSPDGESEAGGPGVLRIVCAGQAEMELRVEALEVRLADTEAVWSARAAPRHEDGS